MTHTHTHTHTHQSTAHIMNANHRQKTKEKDPLNPTREMEKAGIPQKTILPLIALMAFRLRRLGS